MFGAQHQRRLHKIKRRLQLGQHAKLLLPTYSFLSDSSKSHERRTTHKRLQDIVEPDMGNAAHQPAELAELHHAGPFSYRASRRDNVHATTSEGI